MTARASTIHYEIHLEAAPGNEDALSHYMRVLPELMIEHAGCWCQARQSMLGLGWVVAVTWDTDLRFRMWRSSGQTEPLDDLFRRGLISRLQVLPAF